MSENPLGADGFIDDPYPTYAELLAAGKPAWQSQMHRVVADGIWLISGYRESVELLRNTSGVSKRTRALVEEKSLSIIDFDLLHQDPPDHTRLRNLVMPYFTRRRLRKLERDISKLCREFIDEMSLRDEADFMASLALPLPVSVISILLGLEKEDLDAVWDATITILSSSDETQIDAHRVDRLRDAVGALTEYFGHIRKKRLESPGDDLMSHLIRLNQDNSETISSMELAGMFFLMLSAGYETTVNLLGNGLYTLLRHPDQKALLLRDMRLLDSAIEEMLRFESPLQRSTLRLLTDDSFLDSMGLAAGELFAVLIGAANRDPREFPEPNRFDITRRPNRHIAFGAGIHVCLGATLARVEARIVFTQFLERFPNARLLEAKPEWKPNTFLRGLASLSIGLEHG